MSMGGSVSAPHIKPSTATSAFNNTNSFTTNLGGFGTATTARNSSASGRPQIVTNSSLSGDLNNVKNAASSGLYSNLNLLNQTPDQQLASIANGSNAFYNEQSLLNQQLANQQQAQAAHQFGSTGLEDSTARGAYTAQLNQQQLLNDLATRANAIQQQNQLASTAVGADQNTINGLAAILQQPVQMSNNNLYNAFNNRDQMAMFNAQQMQNAATQNASNQLAAAQFNSQQGQSGWGGLIGGAMNLGLAAMTGGASLPFTAAMSAAPSAMSVLPSAFGGAGSNQMSYSPNVSPYGKFVENGVGIA